MISSKLALCVFYLSHPFLYSEFSHSDDGAHTLDPHWWRVNKPFPGVTDAMLDYRPKESWLKGIFKMKLKSHGKIAWRPLSIKGAWKGEKKADVCCCFVAVQPLIINQCVLRVRVHLLLSTSLAYFNLSFPLKIFSSRCLPTLELSWSHKRFQWIQSVRLPQDRRAP